MRRIPNDASGLALDRLREAFQYDPATGQFISRIPGPSRGGGGRRAVGKVAGCLLPSGYVVISLDKGKYRAHRLAWFYMTGSPAPADLQIDHINGNRADNRWANLRLATQVQNSANMLRPHRSDAAKGVSRYENPKTGTVRFRSHITVSGRTHHLGSFPTLREAKAAYLSAARENFGAFARVA